MVLKRINTSYKKRNVNLKNDWKRTNVINLYLHRVIFVRQNILRNKNFKNVVICNQKMKLWGFFFNWKRENMKNLTQNQTILEKHFHSKVKYFKNH